MWILWLSIPSLLLLWLTPYPIAADEVQCYICTSYMSECKSTVDNTDHKVYKSKCNSKCFIRIGEDHAIYRGCFDGFTDVKQLQHDYNGCKNQTWNSKEMLWCFCDGDLCNGKSIKEFPKMKPTSIGYNNDHDSNNDDGYHDTDILNEGGYPVEAHSDYDKTKEESTVHGAEFMNKKPSYKQLDTEDKPTHPRPDIHINSYVEKPPPQGNNPRYGNRRFRPIFRGNINRDNDGYLPAHRQVEQYQPEPKQRGRGYDKHNTEIYREDEHQEKPEDNRGNGYKEDGYRQREEYAPEYKHDDDYGKQYEREEYHPNTEYKEPEPAGGYNHGYENVHPSERLEEGSYSPDYHEEAYYREEYNPDDVHEDIGRYPQPNDSYQHITYEKEQPDHEVYQPREYYSKHEPYPKEETYHGEDVYQHEAHPQHETYPKREPYKIKKDHSQPERYDGDQKYQTEEKDIYLKEERHNKYDEIPRQEHKENSYGPREKVQHYNIEVGPPVEYVPPVHYKPEKEIRETPHLPKKPEDKNEYGDKKDPHGKPQDNYDEYYRPKEYERKPEYKPEYVVHGKESEKKEGSYKEDKKEYEHRENDYPPNGKGDYTDPPKIYMAPIPRLPENRHVPSSGHFVPKPYLAYGHFIGYRPPQPPNREYGRNGLHERNKERKSDLGKL